MTSLRRAHIALFVLILLQLVGVCLAVEKPIDLAGIQDTANIRDSNIGSTYAQGKEAEEQQSTKRQKINKGDSTADGKSTVADLKDKHIPKGHHVDHKVELQEMHTLVDTHLLDGVDPKQRQKMANELMTKHGFDKAAKETLNSYQNLEALNGPDNMRKGKVMAGQQVEDSATTKLPEYLQGIQQSRHETGEKLQQHLKDFNEKVKNDPQLADFAEGRFRQNLDKAANGNAFVTSIDAHTRQAIEASDGKAPTDNTFMKIFADQKAANNEKQAAYLTEATPTLDLNAQNAKQLESYAKAPPEHKEFLREHIKSTCGFDPETAGKPQLRRRNYRRDTACQKRAALAANRKNKTSLKALNADRVANGKKAIEIPKKKGKSGAAMGEKSKKSAMKQSAKGKRGASRAKQSGKGKASMRRGAKKGTKGMKRGGKRSAKGKTGKKRGAKRAGKGKSPMRRGAKKGAKGMKRGGKRSAKGKAGVKRGAKRAGKGKSPMRRGAKKGTKGMKRGGKRSAKGKTGMKRGAKRAGKGKSSMRRGAKK
ncbi:hypothetical protein HDU67_009301, partial [Dinochytrium kinnereticum]